MKTTIKLRDYQEKATSFLHKENGTLVLALCPNSGKTEVLINFIDDFLSENPLKRILVIAHSTRVLLDNFTDRLSTSDIGFTFSEDLSDDSKVHVTIPQRSRWIEYSYDVIIVDEAHENFLAKTVQGIVKNSNPEKVILATGTPSKFIGENDYKFHFYSLSELSTEYRSNLSIKISTSYYDWEGNYNKLNEVKSDFVYTKEDTDNSLINALECCIYDKHNHIEKTVVFCKTIQQAIFIEAHFKRNDIDCLLSHSKNDLSSSLVNEFKEGLKNVLIVVNRARLGFNDPNLVNIVDMSGTLNPDLIYQMYSRVCRKGQNNNKRYVRIRGKNETLLNTEMAISVALMLTSNQYLSKYNGRNFKGSEVLLPKEFFNDKDKKQSESNESTPNKKFFFEDKDDVINFYKNALTDSNYKICTVSDVINILDNSKRRVITLELAKEVCLRYKRREDVIKNDCSIYQWVRKNNKQEECFGHMDTIKMKRMITLELAKEVCLKYKTRSELRRNDYNICQWVIINKKREECFGHMDNLLRVITLELAKEVCLKYKTRSELERNDGSIYQWVRKNKKQEECFGHMDNLLRVITLELAKEVCLKYKTRSELRNEDDSIYRWVLKNKKQEECFGHMKQFKSIP